MPTLAQPRTTSKPLTKGLAAAQAYPFIKGVAYTVLAAVAKCDHLTATRLGYRNGWEMLFDRHDGPEMALFCTHIGQVLSPAQCQLLLDKLAQEFGHCKDWLHFVVVATEHPDWLPVRTGGLPAGAPTEA